MYLHYSGQLQVADMESAFPRQVQPQISVPDFLTHANPIMRQDAGNLHYDEQIGCAHAPVIFVPHNQKITAGGVTIVDNNAHTLSGIPDLNWSTFSVGTDSHIQMFRDRGSWGYQIIDVRSSDHATAGALTLSASTSTGREDQGFVFVFNRAMFTWNTAAGDPYVNLYFTVLGVEYGIQITPAKRVRLVHSTDGGSTYVPLKATQDNGPFMAQSVGNQARIRGTEFQAIVVKVMAGKIRISVPGSGLDFITPAFVPKTDPEGDDDAPERVVNPVISQVRMSAKAFTHITFALHPMMFEQASSMRSNPIQLGFAPDANTPPFYLLHTADEKYQVDSGVAWEPDFPAGVSITATTVSGTETTSAPSYDLDIDNGAAVGTYQGVAYTAQTAVVSKVTMRVKGIVNQAVNAPITIPLGPSPYKQPHKLIERISFDPSQMTIRHTLDVQFTNRSGIDEVRMRSGISGSGNVAISLDLGYSHLGFRSHFRGFADTFVNVSNPNNDSILTAFCCDLMQMVQDGYVFAPPNVDGWNHYTAMAEFLMMAGVPLSQMAFRNLVSDDPFAARDEDTTPYYLPISPGMRPWTPVNRSLPIMDLLDPIRKLTGFLLYVDANGEFRYEPWIGPTPGAPKQVFRTRPTDSPEGIGGGLSEMWALRETSSTKSVRNKIVLVGLDPYQPDASLIIRKRTDDASISSGLPQPPNYVGYPKPFVWMDSRFASAEFADSAIKRLYNLLRQPEYTMEFSSWFQPNLFPMDTIYVDDGGKMNSWGIPFYVMDIVNTIGWDGDKVTQSTQVGARYLDPTALFV